MAAPGPKDVPRDSRNVPALASVAGKEDIMRNNSPRDIQQHIEAMRRDIDRMARAVNRIAKEGGRARAAMAKTAARATKTARASGDEVWEEALNLGADAGRASISSIQSGAGMLGTWLRSPLGMLIALAGIGLLSRRLFHR
jgi:phage-related tail protein